MHLFDISGYPKDGLKSVEEEISFWKKYYKNLLWEEGVTEDTEEKAERIFQGIWLKDRMLFPEVVTVLEFFKNKGFKTGVISDTSPSLKMTLEALDLGKYIDCYICSDLAGVMKPDPRIYQAALETLNVKAEDSIYVDDYDIEADGARALGFTAFHIVRGQELKQEWDISSLMDIVRYVDEA